MTEKTHKILQVGCGNIGSRHLQALARMNRKLIVDVVEPNIEAQTLGKKRLEQIPHDPVDIKVQWHTTIDSIEDTKTGSDLTIIAITSEGRVELIKKLLSIGHKRFLIEKVVCQSSQEYDDLLKQMKMASAKGWVNTPTRYFTFFQKIKQIFNEPQEMIHISVITGNDGLGCNAIHSLDLYSWLTNAYKLHLNGDFLYKQLLKNKRGSHLKEFAGTIIGTAEGTDSVITITYLPYDALPFVYNIVGKGKHYVIDQGNKQCFVLKGEEGTKSLQYMEDYVSNTTNVIVSEIFDSGECNLPTVEQSSFAHKELFRIFNAQIQKITGKSVLICPIT